jgi:parallel beta-helix repeat protein
MLNRGCGIGFGYGPDGAVKNNIISKNGLGIWISNAFNNIISENEVTENYGYGIRLEGSHHDNLIYRNNFIDNSHKGIQASIPNVWYNPMDNGKYAPPQMHATPKPLTFEGATNRWDNGTEGNYWSDNQSSTYVINPDNQDNHPLLSPYDLAATEVPETFPSQRTSTITAGTVNLTNILLATMLLAVIIIGAVLYFKHRKNLVPS